MMTQSTTAHCSSLGHRAGRPATSGPAACAIHSTTACLAAACCATSRRPTSWHTTELHCALANLADHPTAEPPAWRATRRTGPTSWRLYAYTSARWTTPGRAATRDFVGQLQQRVAQRQWRRQVVHRLQQRDTAGAASERSAAIFDANATSRKAIRHCGRSCQATLCESSKACRSQARTSLRQPSKAAGAKSHAPCCCGLAATEHAI